MTDPITLFDGDHAFLSNFWPGTVQLDGRRYPSVEHAYQAAKSLDLSERTTIRDAISPGRAKRLGGRVTMRADWDDVKLAVMDHLLRQKFSDPVLATRLVATAPAAIVEGNTWHDRFWGVCTCERETCRGAGENHLGRLLEQIRDELVRARATGADAALLQERERGRDLAATTANPLVERRARRKNELGCDRCPPNRGENSTGNGNRKQRAKSRRKK